MTKGPFHPNPHWQAEAAREPLRDKVLQWAIHSGGLLPASPVPPPLSGQPSNPLPPNSFTAPVQQHLDGSIASVNNLNNEKGSHRHPGSESSAPRRPWIGTGSVRRLQLPWRSGFIEPPAEYVSAADPSAAVRADWAGLKGADRAFEKVCVLLPLLTANDVSEFL